MGDTSEAAMQPCPSDLWGAHLVANPPEVGPSVGVCVLPPDVNHSKILWKGAVGAVCVGWEEARVPRPRTCLRRPSPDGKSRRPTVANRGLAQKRGQHGTLEMSPAKFQIGHPAEVILVACQEDSAAHQTDTGDEVVRHADPLPL